MQVPPPPVALFGSFETLVVGARLALTPRHPPLLTQNKNGFLLKNNDSLKEEKQRGFFPKETFIFAEESYRTVTRGELPCDSEGADYRDEDRKDATTEALKR